MRARLADDVVLEPLVRGWYAWPLLVAPGTTGMYMTRAHLPIMESFLAAPESHIEACSDPDLAGGPYVDLPVEAVDAVAALHERTRREQVALATLAGALHDLARTLDDHRGEPLEPIYQSLPPVLRGRVELVYDLSHRATFRLIEPLLYRSPELDWEGSQSLLLTRYRRRRPFILSTPRVAGPDAVEAQVPFSSTAVDALAAARWRDVDVSAMADELAIPEPQLAALMTVEPPVTGRRELVGAGQVRVRYFGHATLLVEAGATVLFDPSLTFQPFHEGWPCATAHDLPERIDAIVLTHAHPDHIVLETLLQLRHRADRIVLPRAGTGGLQDPSLRLLFESIGFTDVTELGPFETVPIGDVQVTALPFLGEHADLDIEAKAAFAVAAAGRQLVVLVDSKNVDGALYDQVAAHLGPVDAAFIGMECVGAPLSWLYGALFHDAVERRFSEGRRLSGSNADEALDLVRRLEARRAYVYAIGLEPWVWHLTTVDERRATTQLSEATRFIRSCSDAGIAAERLRGTATITL